MWAARGCSVGASCGVRGVSEVKGQNPSVGAQDLSCDGAEITLESDLFPKLSREGEKLNTGVEG